MTGAFGKPVPLGKTGLMVGRLGLGSSLGGPPELYREAFERGVNYFWWGSIKRFAMRNAVREIVKDGKRDRLVMALVTYARWPGAYTRSLERQLRTLNLSFCDVFLAGYIGKKIHPALLDELVALKQRGLCKHIGLSTHKRSIVPELAKGGVFDVFHIRYSFTHPGAESDLFPLLPEPRPGIVAFGTTGRGKFARIRKPNGKPVGMLDTYRFAISNPCVDLVTNDPGTQEHLRENLRLLEMDPMTDAEREELRQLGRRSG